MTLTVANTILQQLGAGRFVAMTGAKNFVGSPDSLTFSVPGSRKFNKVRVVLLPSDTYRVETLRLNRKTLTIETVQVCEDVYAEDLQEIFTDLTGLYTRLV